MSASDRGKPGKTAAASDAGLDRWNRVGLAATVVILLTIPLAYVKVWVAGPPSVREERAAFVGREACRECHKTAYEKWQDSYHNLAMQEATEPTVLQDFNNVTFDYFGVRSRFYRKDGKFWVHTQGPSGAMVD
jgi:hypothetical protein